MKKTLLFVALGVAFVAVSLWVWLSRGRSAKAVRAKFRLGGALLSLAGLVACGPGSNSTTCYEPAIDCYDPAPENVVWVEDYNNSTPYEVRNGEEIPFCTEFVVADEFIVTVFDSGSLELQRQTFAVGATTRELIFKLDVGDYVGEAELVVSTIRGEYDVPLCVIQLNVVE